MTPAQIQEVVHSAAIEAGESPQSPAYWEHAFASDALAASLRQVRRENGKIGFQEAG